MRAKTLLLAAVLGVAGAVLPASAASACITVYLPVVGSICDPCDALPDAAPCPLP